MRKITLIVNDELQSKMNNYMNDYHYESIHDLIIDAINIKLDAHLNRSIIYKTFSYIEKIETGSLFNSRDILSLFITHPSLNLIADFEEFFEKYLNSANRLSEYQILYFDNICLCNVYIKLK